MKVYDGIVNLYQIKQDYKKEKFKKILILGEFEYNFYIDQPLVDFLNNHDISISYIVGGSDDKDWYHNTISNYGLNNYEFIHLPYFGLLHALFSTQFLNHVNDKKNYKLCYNFVCFNNQPHSHRCLFIDKLAEHNLIKTNVVTWHSDSNYNFQYFDKKIRKLNDNFSIENGYNIPSEYKKSFCNVVTENTTEVINFTEKTGKPLLLNKPFISFGAVGTHRFLKENLNIEFYDEIFDYKFDAVENHNQRAELIIQNLKKIDDINLNDITEMLKDKLEHNKQQILKISNNFNKHLPDKIHEYSCQNFELKEKFESYHRILNDISTNLLTSLD
jgi:hypothetical protein